MRTRARWNCRSLAPSGWDPSTFLHPTPVQFGVFGWGSAKHGGGVGGKRHETWCETRSVLPWNIPIRCTMLLCVQQKTRITLECGQNLAGVVCVCVFEVTQIHSIPRPSQPRSATGAAAVEKPIPACAAVSYYDAPLAPQHWPHPDTLHHTQPHLNSNFDLVLSRLETQLKI